MEKEEALPSFPNSAPTTSHITNLQTNYLEPDILKNLPLQLSEYRKIKNRVLGSRLRQGSEFKSLIKANHVCNAVLSNTSIIEITPNDLIDLTKISSKDQAVISSVCSSQSTKDEEVFYNGFGNFYFLHKLICEISG